MYFDLVNEKSTRSVFYISNLFNETKNTIWYINVFFVMMMLVNIFLINSSSLWHLVELFT